MRIIEFEVTMDFMCWKENISAFGMIFIVQVHCPMCLYLVGAMPLYCSVPATLLFQTVIIQFLIPIAHCTLQSLM